MDFNLTHTVNSEELLRGSGRLERLALLNEKIKKGDLYFLQDGKRSRLIFQEAADSYVNGRFISCIALGFSFIERTIAGRLWHLDEKSLSKKSGESLLSEALNRKWINQGEFVSLNNLRRLRNYTVHFQPPLDEENNVKDLFSPDPRSIDFEENAKQVILAALNVLHKTSI
jgi:hypothetical protein